MDVFGRDCCRGTSGGGQPASDYSRGHWFPAGDRQDHIGPLAAKVRLKKMPNMSMTSNLEMNFIVDT